MDVNIDRVFKFLRYRLRNDGIADAELLRTIEEAAALAARLRFEEEKDLIRLIELQFRCSRAQLADSVILEALLATLTHPDWSAARRLEFIQGQLVSRAPASDIN
jgi:hypothetical protein